MFKSQIFLETAVIVYKLPVMVREGMGMKMIKHLAQNSQRLVKVF